MSPEEIAKEWISNAKLTNGTPLSLIEAATGISRSKLAKLGSKGARLSVVDAEALCRFFDRDIYDLLPGRRSGRPDPKPNSRLEYVHQKIHDNAHDDMRCVIQWYAFSGGRIDTSSPISTGFSISRTPTATDKTLNVVFVGEFSLTATALLSRDPSVATNFVFELSEPMKSDLMQSYLATAQSQKIMIHTRRSMPARPGGAFQYATILMPCLMPNGEEVIAAHSSLLARSPLSIGALEAA